MAAVPAETDGGMYAADVLHDPLEPPDDLYMRDAASATAAEGHPQDDACDVEIQAIQAVMGTAGHEAYETAETTEYTEPDFTMLPSALRVRTQDAATCCGAMLALDMDTPPDKIKDVYNAVVESVRDLRLLKIPKGKTVQFLRWLQHCRLGGALRAIARPGYLLHQWSVPDDRKPRTILRLSRIVRFLLHEWMRPIIPIVPPPPQTQLSNVKQTVVKIVLRETFAQSPETIPIRFDPFVVFFLCTLHTFHAAWLEWACPAVVRVHPAAASWDVVWLYGVLGGWMGKLSTNDDDNDSWWTAIPATATIRIIVQLTTRYKTGIAAVAAGGWRTRPSDVVDGSPAHHCSHCGNRLGCQACQDDPDPEARCVKHTVVKQRPRITANTAVTHGPPADTIAPKGDGSIPITYETAESLNLKIAASNPATLKRCGRDITLFYDQSGRHVGALTFGLVEPSTLQQLANHHEAVQCRYPGLGVQRGKVMQLVEHGRMLPVGSRMPPGGAPCDHYDVYVYMHVDPQNAAHLKMLFDNAFDAFVLEDMFRHASRKDAKAMQAAAQEAGLRHFGRSGITLYYCRNYMSPVHTDADHEFGLALQINKENCDPGEFDFAYVEYGLRFRTTAGCGFYFLSNAQHGTVLPSAESIANGARSIGYGGTVRAKDLRAAAMQHAGLVSWDAMSQGWTNVLGHD